MIELTFQYSEKEYVKAAREYLIINKTIRKIDIIILVIGIIFSIMYLLMSNFNMFSIALLVLCMVSLVIGMLLYFFVPVNIFRSTVKFREQYYLKFSSECIKFKTETINSELKWDVYSKIISNKDFYFLIQHPKIYTILPKRAFEDEQMMEEFEKIAKNYVEIISDKNIKY